MFLTILLIKNFIPDPRFLPEWLTFMRIGSYKDKKKIHKNVPFLQELTSVTRTFPQNGYTDSNELLIVIWGLYSSAHTVGDINLRGV